MTTKFFIQLVDYGADNYRTQVIDTINLSSTDYILARNNWLKIIEVYSPKAENVGDGKTTIGYGFNMNAA